MWQISSASEYTLQPSSKIIFECTNVIRIETYSWPTTLLTYSVNFSGDIKENDLIFINKQTGKPNLFQLSDVQKKNGFLRHANISFMAELPHDGKFQYELSSDQKNIKDPEYSRIPVWENNKFIEIKGDKLQIRVPKTAVIGQFVATAPLIAVSLPQKESNKKEWIGDNKIFSPKQKIISIESETIEHGTLFVMQEIRYRFENGGEYLVKIKLVRDYPFVIVDETMDSLTEADSVSVEMEWTGFQPTKRFGTQWDRNLESKDVWLDIDKPVYTSYSKEDPRWTGMGWIEDPAKKMIFRLSSFGGNSVREQTPVMSFWEEKGENRELGIFVYDFNRWNDYQYGIWQPTPLLSVNFRYSDNKLYFNYPLISGTRSTAISFFPEQVGLKETKNFNSKLDILFKRGGKHDPNNMYYRYSQRLLMQYASLSLDKIKDWQLTYPKNGQRPKKPFTESRTAGTKDEFVRQMSVSAMTYYPLGLNFYPGIHSIEHRILYNNYVEDYLRFYKEMTVAERQTTEALFFLAGYVNTLEEMNAIRNSLAGAANMAADGWCVPPQVAYLFPEHSMANEWMDFFEKSLEIYGLFYTRPEVKSYESKGGRWVESMGIYNWAFLRPVSHSNIAGELYDGKNRFASPYMVERARWMLDMLTAPIEAKGRCFPPHGAHSSGYLVPRYLPMHQTAQWLVNYNPILAENIFWSGTEGDEVERKSTDSKWEIPYRQLHPNISTGTNPHLRSEKFTGHGIVLRAGVNTSEELSIHMNQIDKGPNYRWGNQGEGNTGGLYFYAKGKVFTAHENEIAGDHIANNLDGVTNFGVMKNGEYRTIGMNELKAPLYDFKFAQFAELYSDNGSDKYVWPDYLSRSILLAGTDYFILFDEVGTNWRAAGRFAWFNRNGEDFPEITFLSAPARHDAWTTVQTPNTNGFYRDNFGSLLTLVTHKMDEVSVENGRLLEIPFLKNKNISDFISDKKLPENVVKIKTKESSDFIFRNSKPIVYQENNIKFSGEAGIIRRFNDGRIAMALFKGKQISADGIKISLDTKGKAAISCCRENDGSIYGILKTDTIVSISISGLPDGGKFYINGIFAQQLVFPRGEYHWEYTSGKPTPLPSHILSTEYDKKHVKLYIENTSPCEATRIDVSYDGGKTWHSKGNTTNGNFYLHKEPNKKIHVRAVSLNGKIEAKSAQEYPVYFTDDIPHYPEGLWLKSDQNQVQLSWGEVLGTKTYRLYRRIAGEKGFRLVYEGKERSFTDSEAIGAQKAFAYPGKQINRYSDRSELIVYEYAVTAVNGNGESIKSPVENTDPSSWSNWYPDTELKFKRQSAFWMPPYVEQHMIPEKYYPE